MNDKDLVALDELVNEYQEKEKSLSSLSAELELQSRQFATFLEQQKRQADELEVLKSAIKDYMVEHDIKAHDTGLVELRLSSTGRYSCEDVNTVPDELCKIVRQLDNSAVKAYETLHGELPEGVEPAGWRLSMKLKEQ